MACNGNPHFNFSTFEAWQQKGLAGLQAVLMKRVLAALYYSALQEYSSTILRKGDVKRLGDWRPES